MFESYKATTVNDKLKQLVKELLNVIWQFENEIENIWKGNKVSNEQMQQRKCTFNLYTNQVPTPIKPDWLV